MLSIHVPTAATHTQCHNSTLACHPVFFRSPRHGPRKHTKYASSIDTSAEVHAPQESHTRTHRRTTLAGLGSLVLVGACPAISAEEDVTNATLPQPPLPAPVVVVEDQFVWQPSNSPACPPPDSLPASCHAQTVRVQLYLPPIGQYPPVRLNETPLELSCWAFSGCKLFLQCIILHTGSSTPLKPFSQAAHYNYPHSRAGLSTPLRHLFSRLSCLSLCLRILPKVRAWCSKEMNVCILTDHVEAAILGEHQSCVFPLLLIKINYISQTPPYPLNTHIHIPTGFSQ